MRSKAVYFSLYEILISLDLISNLLDFKATVLITILLVTSASLHRISEIYAFVWQSIKCGVLNEVSNRSFLFGIEQILYQRILSVIVFHKSISYPVFPVHLSPN